MIAPSQMRYFSNLGGFPNKGIPHHLVVKLNRGHLIESTDVTTELRNDILPHFAKEAGIYNYTESGFRLVVDLKKNELPVIHLMAGPDVSAQNPQDWLTKSEIWDPNRSPAFFDRCAEAATNSRETTASGNQMLYAGDRRNIFGVMDGDPKAGIHFLILSTIVFGNMMDAGFTYEHLRQFFDTALQICLHDFGIYQVGWAKQDIRFVANTGTGFQMGPRVHMHVMSSPEGLHSLFPVDYGFAVRAKGLPSLFPVDYGFEVGAKGVISSPPGSEAHDHVIDLIGSRKEYSEFSEAHRDARRQIDFTLLRALSRLWNPR